jgi:RNA polymerase sigma factor (sigma-70 family)
MDEDDAIVTARKQRRLTDAQKALAEAALPLVPSAVRAFTAKHLCYARILRHLDMTSVAQMAVVEASFTYDPAKSKPTTYYGTAIRHALLKEVKRHQRSRESANERVDFAKALNLSGTLDQRQQALACLRRLPPEERELIEAHVIEGRSLMSLGREHGRDWRTIKSRLLASVEKLRRAVSVSTDGPAASSGREHREPD